MLRQHLSLKDKVAKNYINALGWRTSRKLLLLESDDWGTIRIASRDAYETILSKTGIAGNFFDKYDSIESSADLELLFEVLSGVKDKNGRPVVMSPVSVVANPFFEAIEENGYSRYVYESVLDTYNRFSDTQGSFDVAQEGIHEGIWFPQYHGREHINYLRWFKAIKRKEKLSNMAFKLRSLHSGCMPKDLNYFRAFDFDAADEILLLGDVMKEGISLFEDIWGYKPISFCAPCGFIRPETMDIAVQNGIRMFAGQYYIPMGNGRQKRVDKKWGEKIDVDALYYRRNCKFEPSHDHCIDWVDRCLYEINVAFRWGKPAVIDSHRVNFIGRVFPENRDYTLKELKRLLKAVLEHWPDVEFINSKQLYDEMNL